MLGKVVKRAKKAFNKVQRKFTTRGLILMYHRVDNISCDPWGISVSPENFSEHLQVLKTEANVIRLEELVRFQKQGNIPEKSVVITFDDGYLDNFSQAKPLLEQYQIPATIFVASGYTGGEREFWWDELERVFLSPGKLPTTLSLNLNNRVYNWDLSQVTEYTETDFQRDRHLSVSQGKKGSRHAILYSVWETLRSLPHEHQRLALDEILQWSTMSQKSRPHYRPMNVEEAQKLVAGGLIEVGAHTVNHPFLSAHEVTYQHQEISQSKIDLERILGKTITTFAYPFGDYNQESLPLVEHLGFTCACSTEPGPVWWKSNVYELPRFSVGNWNGEEFRRNLLKWFNS